MSSSTLAVRPPAPHAIMLRDPASLSLADWQVICDYLSTSDIVPDSLMGKPANIFLVIQMGLELGLPWVRAIQTIYSPAKGRTGILGTLLVKNIRDHGHKIRWEETADGCTCRIWRKDEPDEPYEATFTRQDAIDARLNEKENYKRYFKRMCRWRATSDCAGFACPEVSLGFSVIEAMDDASPVLDVAPVPPAPGHDGQAAPTSPAQELAEIEASAGESAIRGESDSGGESEGGGEFATVPEPFRDSPAEPQVTAPPSGGDAPASAADRAKAKHLGEQFTKMGWGGPAYTVNRLSACSAFVKRPVHRPSEMKASEVMDLAQQLVGLQAKNPEGSWPVVLADNAAKWKEDWRDADYEAYLAYYGEES